MRCVIARFPFDLTKSGVVESMKGITPELVTGEFVIIGRRHYPAKQVGQVVTRQDRRDFSTGEVLSHDPTRLHLPHPPRRRNRAHGRPVPAGVRNARLSPCPPDIRTGVSRTGSEAPPAWANSRGRSNTAVS